MANHYRLRDELFQHSKLQKSGGEGVKWSGLDSYNIAFYYRWLLRQYFN